MARRGKWLAKWRVRHADGTPLMPPPVVPSTPKEVVEPTDEASAVIAQKAVVVEKPPLTPQSAVKMKVTVSYEHHGGPTFENGKEYYMDSDVADQFILKGYADGDLSRDYTTPEVESVRFGHQHVNTSPDILQVPGTPTEVSNNG